MIHTVPTTGHCLTTGIDEPCIARSNRVAYFDSGYPLSSPFGGFLPAGQSQQRDLASEPGQHVRSSGAETVHACRRSLTGIRGGPYTNTKAFKIGLFIFAALPIMAHAHAQAIPSPQTVLNESKKWTVSGQVVNAVTGAPVPKAMVAALVDSGSTPTDGSRRTVTDHEGRFVISGEEPGSFRFTAERSGYLKSEYGSSRSRRQGIPIRLELGQQKKDIVVRLTPPAALGGRAFDEDGEPIKGVSVMVMTQHIRRGRKEWAPAAIERTNDRGEYRASGLQPGKYVVAASLMNHFGPSSEIRFSTEQPVLGYGTLFYPNGREVGEAQVLDLSAGADLAGIDLALRKTRVYRARGRIQIPSEQQNAHGFLILSSPQLPARVSGPLRQDGSFEIRNLSSGVYVVFVKLEGDEGPMVAQTTLEVSDEDIDKIILQPAAAHTVNGKVIFPDNVGPDKPGTSIALENQGGNPFFALPSAKMRPDGSFSISGVLPGRYRVQVAVSETGVYLKAAEANGSNVFERDLEISGTTTLTLTVAYDSSIVTGQALRKDSPAVGSTIVLVPSNARRNLPGYYRFATADTTGSFRLEGIVPGDYSLFAFDDVDPGECYDPEFVSRFERKSTRVTASPHGSQNLVIEVIEVK